MDPTERKMTKIARELNKLTVQTMKEEGIGTAEFDFIHLVRHHPGITQAQLREELKTSILQRGKPCGNRTFILHQSIVI